LVSGAATNKPRSRSGRVVKKRHASCSVVTTPITSRLRIWRLIFHPAELPAGGQELPKRNLRREKLFRWAHDLVKTLNQRVQLPNEPLEVRQRGIHRLRLLHINAGVAQ
jgi:hypothetical protein